MFIDIYFISSLNIDRDEIEEALQEYLGDRGEVVGAGTGISGSNIDLEVKGDAHQHLGPIKELLRNLGVPQDSVIVRAPEIQSV